MIAVYSLIRIADADRRMKESNLSVQLKAKKSKTVILL